MAFCRSALEVFQRPDLAFGGQTYFAKQHAVDTCGSNGLPLTPNSITIYGRAQLLKMLTHPALCKYLDIIRGKHERIIIVSQYCGQPLHSRIQSLGEAQIVNLCYQVLSGLELLHSRGIVHRNLSPENILLQDDSCDNFKLHNYGLYYMTDCGKLVSFPIVQLSYTCPEVYLQGLQQTDDQPQLDSKGDLWSFGMIIGEVLLRKSFWPNLKLGQIIRKILSLVYCTTNSIFEKIAREHNSYEDYQNLNPDLRQIVEDCLRVSPGERPDASALLRRHIFAQCSSNNNEQHKLQREPFTPCTIDALYHWWQLVGGDVTQELKRQGLIRSTPPILSLPSMVLLDGCSTAAASVGQERNPATLYEARVAVLPLHAVHARLQSIPAAALRPLVHARHALQQTSVQDEHNYCQTAASLPLVIKERDAHYQVYRVVLLRRLLHGYPFTRDHILEEARTDVPPFLRGRIWAAILRVPCDYRAQYIRLDKQSATPTDRQIDVDVPRCHQYNDLLASSDGHAKLKRILKAWLHKHKHEYVYWQGLDSLTAPFLYLNFNDEARAYGCLSAFVPKYLHAFFLKDNSAVIQEYLAKFSQLIAFHDPLLANHLHDITFIPQLFAIPWFLTMFSHVFPLHKILHLWDWLLLCDSSFPLHIGLSVLTQLRARLLSSGFNECILLFSDLPEVDIEHSIVLSLATYKSTPRSITERNYQSDCRTKIQSLTTPLEIGSGVALRDIQRERCPRISAADLLDLIRTAPYNLLMIDIRNPVEFGRASVMNSVNIPFSMVKFGDTTLESLGPHRVLVQNCCSADSRNVVIIGTEDTDLELFPTFLLMCNVPHVCILHGGFNVLLSNCSSLVTGHNNL